MDLHGRSALVTGASRGIGAAIAEHLAEAGADVAIGYRDDHEAAEHQATRIRALGRRALTVGGEVADPARVLAVVRRAVAELGPIDIVVSNAGIGPHQALAAITVEEWDRVMNVNLRPAFLLAQQVAPGMGERGASSSSRAWPPSRAALSGRTMPHPRLACSG
jgi:3-oxoacyl-[acyl-carrier protein] reductase